MLAMARDVLSALDQVEVIDKILLVSSEPEAGRLLRGRKLEVFYSTRGEGINRELELAAVYAKSQGADRAMIVHSDLPLLTEAALNEFVGEAPHTAIRAAACKDFSGTNLLLTPLPLEISLKFGRNSLECFLREAAAHEKTIETVQDERLGMDIDSPEDFNTLLTLYGVEQPPGPETRSLLSQLAGPLPQQRSDTHRESSQSR
jgi:2-phospho-L-lactate guanylyltransferase